MDSPDESTTSSIYISSLDSSRPNSQMSDYYSIGKYYSVGPIKLWKMKAAVAVSYDFKKSIEHSIVQCPVSTTSDPFIFICILIFKLLVKLVKCRPPISEFYESRCTVQILTKKLELKFPLLFSYLSFFNHTFF